MINKMEKTNIRTDKEKYDMAINGDIKIRQMLVIELLIEIKKEIVKTRNATRRL